MLYSLDMIHVCAVFSQWCMFISNSYTCLYACVSGASCHFRSHQVMQASYFFVQACHFATSLPRACGGRWSWVVDLVFGCLETKVCSSWLSLKNFEWVSLSKQNPSSSQLEKERLESFIVLDSILRSFQLAGFELHMHDIVLMDLHGPWFRSATRMKIQRWAGTGIEITHLKAPGWISILCWLL